MTIYLFVGSEQRYTRLKEIHKFAKEYLLDWFPKLVSYQTFVYRLNRLVGAVEELLKHLIASYKPEDCDEDPLIVDSMPIMTCCGRNRKGKVAREIADKGYCSTKNQYYYGLKLHLVGYRRKGHLPFPYQIALSSASENDLSVFKGNVFPLSPERLSSRTRYTVTILSGMGREKSKAMNCSLPSRLSKGLPRRKNRGTRLLMTSIPLLFLLSENL